MILYNKSDDFKDTEQLEALDTFLISMEEKH
jgi:hypothetical protein